MVTKQEIENRLAELVKQHGEWTYDIPLPHGVWTRGDLKIPHTRLKRILQVIGDLSTKPLSSCKVLDLGCLEGQFSIEFALHGANVVGIEAREASVKKAEFAIEALELDNVQFIQDDARNLSLEKYGKFDIVVCSGLLYHMNTPDVFVLIEKIHEMVKDLLVIDTRTTCTPNTWVPYKNKRYHGDYWREHGESDNKDVKAQRLLASFGNDSSFRFTRPSLVNFLSHTGFSSVYECFNPVHLNSGKPGFECRSRCTFVGLKGQKLSLFTSPAANDLEEDWPARSLGYPFEEEAPSLRSRIMACLRRLAERRKLSQPKG